jgi:hypothetical protein
MWNPFQALGSAFRELIHDEIERREEEAAKSIRLELQRRALASTADYVETHLSRLDSDPGRLKLLERALGLRRVEGLICEFGVFSGASVNFLARHTAETVYGFDSFTGLPERWLDGFPPGHFALPSPPWVRQNVRLVMGWFSETLPVFLAEHPEPVSFLHIDCDLYSSTRTVLSLLQPRIRAGTVIVFDDYFNYPGWREGEFKAFQEFVADSDFSYDYIGYNRNDEQAAVIITARHP